MADFGMGGSFDPARNYTRTGATDTGGTYASATLTSATLGAGAILATPVIDGVTQSALNDRQVITEVFALTGAALHAAVQTAVTFPAAAVILRAWLDITTASTGASTIDVGYTATTSTTASDTLLDGVSGTPAAIFDSMNAALDSGANALAQKAASGKWVTVKEATGDVTGMVANLYVQYVLA